MSRPADILVSVHKRPFGTSLPRTLVLLQVSSENKKTDSAAPELPNLEPESMSRLDSSPPDGPSEPFRLETRGVKPQKNLQFWRSHTIHKNTIAAKLRSIGQDDIAEKLEKCHSQIFYAICKGCFKEKTFSNRCDQNFCPECMPKLARERAESVGWWAGQISQPKHLVLTVRNIPDLKKEHFKEFRDWFTKLRRRKFAKNWRGGFYSFEVTNEGRGWHIHLHCLIDARFIDKNTLSEQWSQINGGVGYIVDVSDARDKSYLKEVTKYAVKGSQLAAWTPDQISTFIHAIDGVRTFGVFGCLFGKRSEWQEWLSQIKTRFDKCECGCSDFWIRDEHQHLLAQVNSGHIDRPPPPDPSSQVEFQFP